MAKATKTRTIDTGSGKSHIRLEMNFEQFTDNLKNALVEKLTPIAAAMETRAKALCPVSELDKPTTGRSIKGAKREGVSKVRPRDTKGRLVYDGGRKRGQGKGGKIVTRNFSYLKNKHKSRMSGRLRDSIHGYVAVRHDKTAVMLYLKAGDNVAYYAPFVEFGTWKMKAKPFMRPAFNLYKQLAIRAIYAAVEQAGKD